jgi:hypothetical protein
MGADAGDEEEGEASGSEGDFIQQHGPPSLTTDDNIHLLLPFFSFSSLLY